MNDKVGNREEQRFRQIWLGIDVDGVARGERINGLRGCLLFC